MLFRLLRDSAALAITGLFGVTTAGCEHNDPSPLPEAPVPVVPMPPLEFRQGGGFNFGGMAFLPLPAGTNELGRSFIGPGGGSYDDPAAEKTLADETRRSFVLSTGMFIGQVEVTRGVYHAVMALPPVPPADRDRPIASLTFDEAKAFCHRLSGMAERAGILFRFRLPGEDEWEYACRAGTHTPVATIVTPNFMPAFDKQLEQFAWYQSHKVPGGGTAVCRTLRPNPWQMYDFHGNVAEWCEPSPGLPKPPPGTAPIRGGGWTTDYTGCRSSSRELIATDVKKAYIGLRVLAWSPLDALAGQPVPVSPVSPAVAAAARQGMESELRAVAGDAEREAWPDFVNGLIHADPGRWSPAVPDAAARVRAVATVGLARFRNNIPDAAQRRGAWPDYRTTLEAVWQRSGSSAAALLIAEDLVPWNPNGLSVDVESARGPEVCRYAFEWAQRGASAPPPFQSAQGDACVYLSDLYLKYRPLADTIEGLRWLEKGRAAGHADSIGRLGWVKIQLAKRRVTLGEKSDAPDIVRSTNDGRRLLLDAANNGSTYAEYICGSLCIDDSLLARSAEDRAKQTQSARYWLTEAARKKFPPAIETCQRLNISF